ncbi:ABC transporter substrate-binding protein [Ectobacillus ponti]|uniref:Glycine/betaine ABC transporter substrate-binding protein n=1 Tax=Ectobacillus ponti TaxID=2961894 RepID=A0AA42BUV6_9BACI|nr:glycine betaine ABC transporter substrate-binding protein [Ectobacillus ponti]MCP8970918.1 glycine/betaine ABC transporter substrate-binding protein [Ectobacillus ponti]
MKKKASVLATAVLGVSLLLGACSSNSTSGTAEKKDDKAKSAVVIGSKDFTENALLGEMYAQVLEANDIPVQRKINLGGTMVAFEAIKNGDIDLYPEYTGTGLLAILKKPVEKDQKKVLQINQEGFKQWGIEWLEPSPLNNTFAFVTTKEVASKHKVDTITDLASSAKDLVLAFPQEFDVRDDGLPGLQKMFKDKGGFKFSKQFQIDASIRFEPIQQKKADVSVVYGTDGQIAGYDLQLIKDDVGFFPVYNVAPIIRSEKLKQYPKAKEALDKLSPLLTDDVMSKLNWKIDGPDKKDYATVAKEFLKEKGLVK